MLLHVKAVIQNVKISVVRAMKHPEVSVVPKTSNSYLSTQEPHCNYDFIYKKNITGIPIEVVSVNQGFFYPKSEY